MTVGIVGLGLIGGSMAKAYKAAAEKAGNKMSTIIQVHASKSYSIIIEEGLLSCSGET